MSEFKKGRFNRTGEFETIRLIHLNIYINPIRNNESTYFLDNTTFSMRNLMFEH